MVADEGWVVVIRINAGLAPVPPCNDDCVLESWEVPGGHSVTFQHGDNPEHRLELTDEMQKSDNRRWLLGEWLQRIHEYERG